MLPGQKAAFASDGLEALTNGFSQDNVIGNFQFGKVYRANDEYYKQLMVKVWDNCEAWPEDNERRLKEECYLAYDDRLRSHPNMINIFAISWPDCRPALAYQLNALDTVHNLQEKGKWSKKCDVFAYGVVLIGLISKRVVLEKNKKTSQEPFLYDWAHDEYWKAKKNPNVDPSKFSVIHKSLETEAFFSMRDGVALTKLAMQCVNYNPQKRPTMKQVVNGLRELCIVQNHADVFGLGNVPTAPRPVISEVHNLMMKKLEACSMVKEKASHALFKYLSRKDKLVSAGKERQYVAPKRISYDDLKIYTNGFSEGNFINIHQFGKLYHGKVDSLKVTVKTWDNVYNHHVKEGDNEGRLRDELILLQHPKFVFHPDIVKLIGYCYENERLGVVYDLQSLDSLQNLIPKDSFTWRKRVIFILQLARLVKYFQQRNPPYSPYLLRNICPDDILVDTDYKPKLFNFGMLLGGILNDKKAYRIRHVHVWEYYTDPYTDCYENYTEVSDIYSLGMVILNTITKITYIDSETKFDARVRNEYEKAEGRRQLKHFNLTDNNFCKEADFDPVDGHRITKLAMQCIHRDYWKRPTIDQVVDRLKNLKIMKCMSVEKH
uniref:Protein kinase domain-containing protein n=1 Tax=Kalanchoe fedtschenkoi TaxID=63787 RepID=A0A7N0T5C3_KALFE